MLECQCAARCWLYLVSAIAFERCFSEKVDRISKKVKPFEAPSLPLIESRLDLCDYFFGSFGMIALYLLLVFQKLQVRRLC